MKNYIELNGQKIEITDKQCNEIIKALANIPAKQSPFERKIHHGYYSIYPSGRTSCMNDLNVDEDILCYNNANYCTDKVLMKQRAFYEKVERNLWRFSMENGGSGDWIIGYDINHDKWIYYIPCNKYFGPSFKTEEIARRAIDEVLIPLLKQEEKYHLYDLFDWSI